MKMKKCVSVLMATACIAGITMVANAEDVNIAANQSTGSSDMEITPYYTNILTTYCGASKTYINAQLTAKSTMALTIKAVAKGKTYSVSDTSALLVLDEEVSLSKGDTVKFTFTAGGETVTRSVTVS